MRYFLFLVAALCAGALPGCKQPVEASTTSMNEFQVIGYLPDYRVGSVNSTLLGKYYTDIILFSIQPTASGDLDTGKLDSAWPLVSTLKSAGTKRVLVAVGGWDRSQGFSPAVSNPDSRSRLVSNLTQLCLDKGLAGIDLDWEFPEPGELSNYNTFIKDLGTALHNKGLIITAALNRHQDLGSETYKLLDRVHFMAYDEPGEHSTYEMAQSAISEMTAKGIPANKLVLGMPFYGKDVNTGTAQTFAEIDAQSHPSSSTDRIGNVYFNGPDTLRKKVNLAKEQKLAGVMVWEVGQDTPDLKLSSTVKAASG